jgi:hypothetical protein
MEKDTNSSLIHIHLHKPHFLLEHLTRTTWKQSYDINTQDSRREAPATFTRPAPTSPQALELQLSESTCSHLPEVQSLAKGPMSPLPDDLVLTRPKSHDLKW